MDRNKESGEKRKDIRLNVAKSLIIKLQLPFKKPAAAENISTGGICIELPLLTQRQIKSITSGKKDLILELELSGLKKPLRIKGKIAWWQKKDKPSGVAGISFEGLKEKDREEILRELLNLCLKGGFA